jgi:hypothetical protein
MSRDCPFKRSLKEKATCLFTRKLLKEWANYWCWMARATVSLWPPVQPSPEPFFGYNVSAGLSKKFSGSKTGDKGFKKISERIIQTENVNKNLWLLSIFSDSRGITSN